MHRAVSLMILKKCKNQIDNKESGKFHHFSTNTIEVFRFFLSPSTSDEYNQLQI